MNLDQTALDLTNLTKNECVYSKIKNKTFECKSLNYDLPPQNTQNFQVILTIKIVIHFQQILFSCAAMIHFYNVDRFKKF